MKVTIDGITYEGTSDEIRYIVENPPTFGGLPKPMDCPPTPTPPPTNEGWPWDLFPRNRDGSPRVTCWNILN